MVCLLPFSFCVVADEIADLAILREGCFRYFELGGEAVAGPVSLLSAYVPSSNLVFPLLASSQHGRRGRQAKKYADKQYHPRPNAPSIPFLLSSPLLNLHPFHIRCPTHARAESTCTKDTRVSLYHVPCF
jgi:hypothetical protein